MVVQVQKYELPDPDGPCEPNYKLAAGNYCTVESKYARIGVQGRTAAFSILEVNPLELWCFSRTWDGRTAKYYWTAYRYKDFGNPESYYSTVPLKKSHLDVAPIRGVRRLSKWG